MRLISAFTKIIWLPTLVAVYLFSFDLKYDLVGLSFLFSISQVALFLVFIFVRSPSVNLITAYYLFTLIFFGFAPWIHYSAGGSIWRSQAIDHSTYVTLNLLIFFTSAVVFLTYLISQKSVIQSSQNTLTAREGSSTSLILLALSILSFTLLFYLNDFSVAQLFFRGILDELRPTVIESSSLVLLFGITSRLIPVFCFFYAVTQLTNSATTKILLFFLFIISVFPTSIARYMVAFAYIPLILTYVPKIRSASIFAALLIISLLFVFPFLDQFRYFSGLDNFKLLPSSEFFYAAHFDAYENFASAIDSNFITYGYQIFGAALFFVPRILWPTKPVGSGYEMADRLGYDFNNISMPFLAEGFVNFGISGVLLFAIFIGYLMKKIDGRFSSITNPNKQISFSTTVYYYLIGALFFVLRGDMLSSTAYLTAGLFSAFLVKFLCKPTWV